MNPPAEKQPKNPPRKKAAKPAGSAAPLRRPSRAGTKKSSGRKRGVTPRGFNRRTALLVGLEALCLTGCAVIGIVILLGHAAGRFSGSDPLTRLLPFTLGVVGLILAAALLLLGWLRLRRLLAGFRPILPLACALALTLMVCVPVLQGRSTPAFSQFRLLVGGREEAARVTLAHQVFAAYRRQETAQLQQLISRAQPFGRDIEAAARSFGLDPDLLFGIAAAESSYLPRDSRDGGKGLFQITQAPEAALREAGSRLGIDSPQVEDHRHNSFIAAATLRHYLGQMRNDLFLGLLAYNIGPKNGGLRFIMQQYGAIDFVTLQPYLQQLPRDYPIRVLAYALAFRLWRHDGRLPAYEEGLNAVRIQHTGIPGL